MEAAGRREALCVIDELLQQEDRDVGTFVSSACESLSLEVLRVALGTRIAGTKADLISAINSDYSVFVSLSAALEGSGSSVLRLQRPLGRVAAQLREVAEASRAHRHTLGSAREGVRAAGVAAAAARALAAAQEALEGAAGALAALALPAAAAAAGQPEGSDSEWSVDVSEAHAAWEGGSAAGDKDTQQQQQQQQQQQAPALLPASSPLAALAWLHSPCAAAARAHGLCRASRLLQLARAAAERGAALLEQEAAAQAEPSSAGGHLPAALAALLQEVDAAVEHRLLPALRECTISALTLVGECRSTGSSPSSSAPPPPAAAPLPPQLWSPLDLPPSSPHLVLHLCFLAWSHRGPGGLGTATELAVARCTKPLLSRLLSQGRLDEGGSRGSYKGIGRVFEEYLNEASSVVEWLLACSGSGSGSGSCPSPPPGGLAGVLLSALHCPGLHPIPALLWAPLVDHFAASLSSFFFPAHPAVFHSNYSAISAFFSRLRVAASALQAAVAPAPPLGSAESGATCTGWLSEAEELGSLLEHTAAAAAATTPHTSSSDSALVRHPSTIALAGVWRPKLGVYATLRAQEATARLEKALTGPGSRVAAGAGVAAAALAAPPPLSLLLCEAVAQQQAGAATGWQSAEHLAGALAAVLAATATAAPTASPTASRQQQQQRLYPAFTLPPPHYFQAPCTLLFPGAPAALWGCLHTIWAPATHFLPPLLPNTLQLSQQLLSRYAAWHTAGIALCAAHCGLSVPGLGQLQQHSAEGSEAGEGGGGAAAAAAAQPLAVTALLCLPALPAPFTRALVPGALTLALSSPLLPAAPATSASLNGTESAEAAAAAAARGPAAAASATPSISHVHPDLAAWQECVRGSPAGPDPLLLLLQARDLATLARFSTFWLASQALQQAAVPPPAAAGAPPPAAATLAPLLAPILTTATHLHDLAAYPRALATALLSRAAAAAAGAVRTVPGSLRAGSSSSSSSAGQQQQQQQQQPATPSPYTATLFSGLRQCLAHSSLLAVGSADTAALVGTVVADALAAFAGVLGSTLESLSTLEASLQWLKKGGGGGGGEGSSSPAPEGMAVRIGVQLTLDCRALGAEVGGGAIGDILGLQWQAEEGRLVAVGGRGGSSSSSSSSSPPVEAALAAFERALHLCAPYAHLVGGKAAEAAE